MDEMRLESKFTTGLVSKIARTVVRKKLGYDGYSAQPAAGNGG